MHGGDGSLGINLARRSTSPGNSVHGEIRPSVYSEVGRLHAVIIHRPGRELELLAPASASDMLYDDVPWAAGAAAEHDAFAAAVASRGTRVLYLTDLLADALEDRDRRAALLDATMPLLRLTRQSEQDLRNWLDGLPSRDLTARLIGGVMLDELPFSPTGLMACPVRRPAFAVPPLPNLVFVRDPSSWIRSVPTVNRLTQTAREREHILFRAVHGAGRMASPIAAPVASDVEGGDILISSPDCVVLAVSGRSSAAAVESLAGWLLADGVREVVVTEIPDKRRSLHLDTVLTMVDTDRVMVSGAIAERLTGHRLRLTPAGHLACAQEGEFFSVWVQAMGLPGIDIIHADGNRIERERDQWNEASNLLALSPGVVVSYARNTRANEALTAAGIEVLAVPGAELTRGRGGPHCMSCPVERAPAR